jgi:hypothetical protein
VRRLPYRAKSVNKVVSRRIRSCSVPCRRYG